MESNEPFYLHTLRESFGSRQRKNAAYSLRAFAKDLEIDSSNLSAIFQRKRGLPYSRAGQIAKRLKLSPKESALFVASTMRKQMRLDSIKVKDDAKKYLLEDKYYKIISEWEYYALLQLLQTKGFNPSADWIAKRLGISESRTIQVLRNLIDLEFIKEDSKKGYVRLSPSLETSEDIESQALQISHIESLNLGKEKLEKVAVDLRDYSSITIAINPEKIPEAKAVVREFQEKLYALLSQGEKTEVYQFNCQLFPLTRVEK